MKKAYSEVQEIRIHITGIKEEITPEQFELIKLRAKNIQDQTGLEVKITSLLTIGKTNNNDNQCNY